MNINGVTNCPIFIICVKADIYSFNVNLFQPKKNGIVQNFPGKFWTWQVMDLVIS